MGTYFLNEQEYELIEDYKGAFDYDLVNGKITDYFIGYDYIIGDWAYGKIRLKGFCKRSNPLYKEYNSYVFKGKYLKEFCSYDCKYFVLKKIGK